MTRAFDDLAAQRDPLYAATLPQGEFDEALKADELKVSCMRRDWFLAASEAASWRDANLLQLAVRALRNQGEPYYTHKEVQP